MLDAGCGPGLYLEALRAGGAELIACDASPRMVELARARIGEGVELRVHSLDEPFDWIADDSIDVVLCALAYHYVNERPRFSGRDAQGAATPRVCRRQHPPPDGGLAAPRRVLLRHGFGDRDMESGLGDHGLADAVDLEAARIGKSACEQGFRVVK